MFCLVNPFNFWVQVIGILYCLFNLKLLIIKNSKKNKINFNFAKNYVSSVELIFFLAYFPKFEMLKLTQREIRNSSKNFENTKFEIHQIM